VRVSCAKRGYGDASAAKIDDKTIRSNAYAMR
jgi:hypothetical protein